MRDNLGGGGAVCWDVLLCHVTYQPQDTDAIREDKWKASKPTFRPGLSSRVPKSRIYLHFLVLATFELMSHFDI